MALPISIAARLLSSCISLAVCAYGIFIIMNEHYYGRTTKLGGAEVSVDGIQTLFIGVGIIMIGLIPMSFWAKTPKIAGWWAASMLIAGVSLMLSPSLFLHSIS